MLASVSRGSIIKAPSISSFFKRSASTFANPSGGEESVGVPHLPDYKSRIHQTDNHKKAFTYFIIGTAGFTYASFLKNVGSGLVDTMNASADVLAMANTEINLSGISEGSCVTLKWRGKPLFVKHRTDEEIQMAIKDDSASFRDPASDSSRVKDPKWLVLLGVCTHLGCVPLPGQGEFKGFLCPCHGSHYDTSGRIRKGPAPLNLEVPPYKFVTDDLLLVGSNE